MGPLGFGQNWVIRFLRPHAINDEILETKQINMSDGNGNGNDKGKSPVRPQQNQKTAPSNEPSNSESLFSRITASATGLTRSTFLAPTANELSNQAATALADSGKGQSQSSSSNGSSAWAESSKTAQQTNQCQSSGTGSAGLRTGHHEQHVQQSENEFSSFLDGMDSFTPPENVALSSDRKLEDAWHRSQVAPRGSTAPERSVAQQESRDGDEVLAILSSPRELEEDFEPPQDDQEYDWGLSKEQLIQLRAMTKEIFPLPETHVSVAADHPLNLNPSFEGELVEARERWREQWEDVLTRYTDEVWGGLLPLVKQAREEIEGMGEGDAAKEKPTALRRLEAILGHLQQR
jgi:hypothetical protein